MVTIELNRVDGDYHMVATNAKGNVMHIDNNSESGGQDAGIGPMQSLLAAVGGCSVIDVVSILKKQRQNLTDIKVTVQGEREPNATPSLYKTVHVHFTLFGQIDPDKAEKAVQLSIEKYCSVAETLRRAGATISYRWSISN